MAQLNEHLVVAELWINWHTNFWGVRNAYPIPYFDDGPAKEGLHIGGTSHDQGGVMTYPDCAKYSTEEAVVTCESW